jgi:phenylalanyl-tRNA synthetase beta chain
MKISLDWVSDFVDLSGIAPEAIADRLTLCTAEVEGFEVLRRIVDGVVIGEVVSVEPLSGNLRLTTVNAGARQYTTVCGAPNVRAGMKTAFAPPGVTLAGGTRIEASEVGGRRSEGVLCSAMELGMSRWHEVLLECPASLANGTPLSQLIPAEDVIIEIDNKSLTHRPDLWGHYGIARELAAIFGRELRALPSADLAQYDSLPAFPLTIEDLENCPCYGCLEFCVPPGLPSPLVMQRRLHALGQRTFNLLVDVTNYVMLELAQPTHAFDGDLVRAIRVAPMGRPGTFTTLDGQERQMLPDDLLIWNQEEPVALAGIMGGLASEVRSGTRRLLLESANFKASRIRRTSVRLDLRTDSAQRFEKSQPPANVKTAIGRILRLIQEAGANPEVTSRLTVAGDLKDNFRPLVMPRSLLQTMAGKEIADEEVTKILHSLGFQARFDAAGQLHLGIPPHRSEKDLSIPADIVEEVLRVYGYGRIEPRMPAVSIRPLHVEKPLRREHKARRLLALGHGFVEVQNYGWFDEPWLGQLSFTPDRTLTLKNPSAQQNRLLRTTLIPNLLALVGRNRVHRDDFRLFEIGRVYSAADDGTSNESTRLAGVSFHQMHQPTLEEHFRAIRGVVEDLGRVLSCGPLVFDASAADEAPWQLPGHFVSVVCGGKHVGSLGALGGKVLETVAQDGQVIWFELAMDALEGPIYPELKYQAPPIYPGSWQDFSLTWDVTQGFAALQSRLDAFSHPLVMRREFLYVYKGKGLPPGKGSYSFRYWLGAWDRTLTSEQIEEFRNALLAFLQTEGIPLRG